MRPQSVDGFHENILTLRYPTKQTFDKYFFYCYRLWFQNNT